MEFFVDTVSVEENIYYLTGVCDRGIITLDSFFYKIYRYTRGKDSQGFPVTSGKEFLSDTKLQVKRIRAYRHDLDELHQGMSAELWLIGEGEVYLKPKLLLGQN